MQARPAPTRHRPGRPDVLDTRPRRLARRLPPDPAAHGRPPLTDQTPAGSGGLQPPPDDVDVGDTIGPFEVEGRLGRGGTASVLVVRDTRDGRRAALKLLRHCGVDPEVLATRFRREFRSLSRLHHPNLVRVEEWGVLDDRPWFTMEYIEGTDLRAAARELHALSDDAREARIRDIVTQTARALAYVHDHGLVHRDISPGNLLLRRDGTVKLTDFGLVRGQDSDHTSAMEILGTVAYAAPEQLKNERVDGRADLYALGVVLYELLTGRKPFRAHTVQGWLERHLRETPRAPRDLDPLVPEDLDRICMRLLEKDPANRFASAWHLLSALGDRGDDAVAVWPPRLVGRTDVLAWMRAGLEEVAAGRPGGVRAVVGPSGSGKTRLLSETARHARRRGLPVAVARCRPHDRPYGAFKGIVDGVDPATVPALLRALYDEEGATPERWPVLEAFLALLRANRPAVVLVDGLEHADAATREVVGFLVRNSLILDTQPVLFLLAAEGTDARALPIGLGEDLPVSVLRPVSAAEVEELVFSMIADEARAVALARRLYRETSGNPAHLADMLHALVDEKILVEGPHAWELVLDPDEIESSDLPLPPSLRATLAERLAPLDEDARRIARILALHPGPLDLDTLVEASPYDEETAMDALDRLVEAGIAAERRAVDTEVAELSHSRFRDVLLAEVDPATLATWHRILGEHLEARHRHHLGPVVEALAWHFEQAGVAPKAFAYLARSGRRHLARGLHDTAARLLDRALRTEASARPYLVLEEADREALQARLDRAEARYHLGRWDGAVSDARAALTLADALEDPRESSRAHAALGAILRWRSEIDEAEPHLRAAIEQGRAVDDPALLAQPTYHLGAIAWMRQELDIAEARWHHARELARRADDARATGLTLVGLGILAFCRGDTDRAREQLEEAVTAFEARGMQGDLAIARVDLVELNLSTGLLSRALQDADRTVARARALHQPQGVAMGLVWRARVLRAIGRLEDGQRCAQESLGIAERIGAIEEEIGALGTLTAILLAMDLPHFAKPRAERLRAVLARVDHEGARSFGATLHARVLAALGDVDGARAALAEAEAAVAPFPHVHVRMAIAAGKARAALGDHAAAERQLEEALQVAGRHGYRYFELVAHHMLATTAHEASTREGHAVASGRLARALAQGLTRDDASAFRARGWAGLATP